MEKIIIEINKMTLGIVLVVGIIIGGALGFGIGGHEGRGRDGGCNQGYENEYGGRMMYNRGDTNNRAIMMERAGFNQAAPTTTTTNPIPATNTKPIVVPTSTTTPAKI